MLISNLPVALSFFNFLQSLVHILNPSNNRQFLFLLKRVFRLILEGRTRVQRSKISLWESNKNSVEVYYNFLVYWQIVKIHMTMKENGCSLSVMLYFLRFPLLTINHWLCLRFYVKKVCGYLFLRNIGCGIGKLLALFTWV